MMQQQFIYPFDGFPLILHAVVSGGGEDGRAGRPPGGGGGEATGVQKDSTQKEGIASLLSMILLEYQLAVCPRGSLLVRVL